LAPRRAAARRTRDSALAAAAYDLLENIVISAAELRPLLGFDSTKLLFLVQRISTRAPVGDLPEGF
jgi:hypothetical protein